MSEDLHIRRAVVKDTAVLAAFNQALTRETEGKELSPATVQAGVADLLAWRRMSFIWSWKPTGRRSARCG